MGTSSRGSYGDRSTGSPGTQSNPGGRTVSPAGPRGGPGGPQQGGSHPGGEIGGRPGGSGYGGHPGGGRPGRGHHGGGRRGWYCPPTYWGGSSWSWGGPWDWWWGWGPYWGLGGYWGPGSYWGRGGVYVIDDGVPAANQYARVDTDVEPETAEIYLDGTLIGQADDFDGFPDYLYLEAGKYRLEFRHSSYETVVKEVEVRAGQAIAVSDEMKLLSGKQKLQVVDPENTGTPLGRVFGRPAAQGTEAAGDRTGRFDVEGGPDTGIDGEPLEIELDGLDEDVQAPEAPAPPADAESWRAPGPKEEGAAPASQGRLRFEVEPDDAAVYVDDRYVGTAEELGGLRRGLRVAPGKHTVTVVRPGYGTKTVDVEAKPGAGIDVVIELER